MTATFTARYRGRCNDCEASILPGDTVRYDGDDLVHDDCGDVPVNVDPEAAACRSKVRSTAFARLLSATYSALAAEGRLESLGYVGTNDDAAGGNAGKPQRHWRWVA